MPYDEYMYVSAKTAIVLRVGQIDWFCVDVTDIGSIILFDAAN